MARQGKVVFGDPPPTKTVIEEISNEIVCSSPAALPSFKERLMRAGYLELDATLYEKH